MYITSLSTDPLCVYLTTSQVTKFPRPFLFIFAYCKWQAVKALERSYGQHTHDFEVKSGQRLEIKPSLYKMCHNNLIYRTCHKRNDVLYTCRPPVRSMPVHVEHVAALLVCADASLCLVCTTAWTWRMYPLWLERWATRIHYWLGVYHNYFPSTVLINGEKSLVNLAIWSVACWMVYVFFCSTTSSLFTV